MNLPEIKPIPINDSHNASTGINKSGSTKYTVLRTSSSAGLRPGKNFNIPNQKNIIPNPMRRNVSK